MLRIALLQLVSCGRDPQANLRKGETFCRRAAALGAEVALFPEMWSVGYRGFDPQTSGDREAWRALAEPAEGPFVSHFRKLAAELGMAVGITWLEEGPEAPRNAFALFDRRGGEALRYAKVHLPPWDPPDNACAPGEGFPVGTLETADGAVRVGAMICFDREFPEAARVLALRGAELVLTPNACDLDDRRSGWGDVRIAQFRTRAFENLLAAAMANYAAPEHDGHSVAFLPDGTEIARGDSAEGIVLADVDLERVRRFRMQERDREGARRPETYAPIAASEPDAPSPGGGGD